MTPPHIIPIRHGRFFSPTAAVLVVAAVLGVAGPALSVDPAGRTEKPPSPPAPDGTKRALQAMATFRVPAGLKVNLFAADPMLGSPVAICLDEQNRVYVAEEYRFNQGAEENRTRGFFLEDDLQSRTLDDRLAMMRKWAHKFDGGMSWFSKHADQVRRLEDTKGVGAADVSTVFAGGFNDPLDGLAAGVIARDGDVWLTCIPHLWKLKDTKGTGTADVRTPLLRGFGVNFAYLGHDLHGLAWGPDGKLYFSVGDRGFNVTSKEGNHFVGPRRGGVFRCDPDGAGLELVAVGLRNPQELAFDQYGNLFADDNNCDKGDHSRLVYVVEDGDSGWNMAYQTIAEPYLTGPWHAERMWHLAHNGQPAWIVPPVGKLGAGPSGFTFTSGLSLPERYRNKFFMCNYTGNGGVESFGVVPDGAGFQLVDYHDFLKPVMATDVEVGYDGKVYVSDFVQLLWNGGSAGGRIYTVSDPDRLKDPVVREVTALFKTGFKQRTDQELKTLLAHPDSRVRQRAQFTLAARGPNSIPEFHAAVQPGNPQLARLHALWGFGQLARTNRETIRPVLGLLTDADAEVRAQAARVLGWANLPDAAGPLTKALTDPAPRVRFFAAEALGKLGDRSAVGPVFDLLKANDDKDPFVRHAAVAALARIGDKDAVATRFYDKSAAVRLAAVLVQRRWQDPAVARFLDDADLGVATEAARAVNDLPVESGFPALAKLLERYTTAPAEADPLVRRALNANFRLGGPDHLRAVVRLATSPGATPVMRAEAVAMLSDWAAPGPRDRVTGVWRPLTARDPDAIRNVLEDAAPHLLSQTDGKLQADAVALIGKLGIRVDESTVFGWIPDITRDVNTRTAALRLLAVRKSPKLNEALAVALQDGDARLRAEAQSVLADTDPARAVDVISHVLSRPDSAVVERQRAFPILARVKPPAAGHLLDQWAAKLANAEVPAELRLDVLEALKTAPTPARTAAAAKFEAAQRGPQGTPDPLARFRISLRGGDAERGLQLFVGHSTAQCVRCHRVNGQGGDAGPDLSKVAARTPGDVREYLLESMILPNAKIAPGYGSVVVVLNSGKLVAGTLKAEDKTGLTLLTADGKTVVIPMSEVDERTPPTSAMPAMERVLTPRELRDLVEFLAGLH